MALNVRYSKQLWWYDMAENVKQLAVGDRLPPHLIGPITRTTLALFAGASGDHNPIHLDIDFAKKSGLDDVFAHGMLSMAYLAQLITRWVPQSQIRSWEARFTSITPVGAIVECSGHVTEIFEADGEKRARLEITSSVQGGAVTLAGFAEVAIK
jgi:acyl dehydratase